MPLQIQRTDRAVGAARRRPGPARAGRSMASIGTSRTPRFEVRIKNKRVVWDTKGSVEESGLDKFGSSEPGNPKSPPIASLTYRLGIFMPDQPELGPALMIISKTSTKSVQDLLSPRPPAPLGRDRVLPPALHHGGGQEDLRRERVLQPDLPQRRQRQRPDLIEQLSGARRRHGAAQRPRRRRNRRRRRRPARRAPGMTPTDLALDLITSAQTLVIDTETTGLDPHTDRVCGWVVATEGHRLYLPVRHSRRRQPLR